LQVKDKGDTRQAMMKLFEQIPLANGLTAEVYDLSRPIAADTTKVEMTIKIRVELLPEYFTETAQFGQTRAAFGPEIFFEYRMGQSFVGNEEKDHVFRTLLETFKRDSLPYLSSPKFSARFAQSKYREILQNPYKYRIPQDDRTESA
jgi:hypothetical protein